MFENKYQIFCINDEDEKEESCNAIANNPQLFPRRPDINLVTADKPAPCEK